MDPNHPFFDHIEKVTNVNREDIFQLAQSIANADFQDEATVRNIVARVASLANVNVPKEKEDKIVQAILNNKVPMNFSSLAKMFEKR